MGWFAPVRPKLADVMGMLTERDAAWWRGYLEHSCGRCWFDTLGVGIADSRPEAEPGLTIVAFAMRDPDEAWEALASRGLIPSAWVTEPPHVFEHLQRLDLARPYPPTLEECAAFASDAAAVTHAASLGREVVARLVPWRRDLAGASQAIAWRGVRASWAGPRSGLWAGIPNALVAAGAEDRGDERHKPGYDATLGVSGYLSWMLHQHRRWRDACARGLRVSVGPLREQRPLFRDLPSPFDPLIELWETGYGLDEVDHATLRLAAPLTWEGGWL